MGKSVAQIIAQAIYDAGATVVTNVPGFGGTQVFDAFREVSGRSHPNSFHEEVAYSIAHGASLVGQRSATVIKAHGFAKAANSVADSLIAGTTAGFVILVPDDKLGKHSDGIFDIAAFVRGLGIPRRTLQVQDVYRQVLDAFSWSEALQLPVVLLIDADDIHQVTTYTPVQGSISPPAYQRDVTRHVLCPLLAEHQHRVMSAKVSGQNWRGLETPALPTIPDTLPKAWQPLARLYAPLFEVFQTLRGEVVAGDTGVSTFFAFPPYNCVDICTYMGGSIPLAVGAYLAGRRNVWAVTGDFAFIAAGHLGLLEAVQRDIPLKVLICYNRRAQTTGGQPIPYGILERILVGYESQVRHINDPQDAREIVAVLGEASSAQEMRIVVADYGGGVEL
jgi:TPP-dependent indolepyruvate ferredoxin oxidoreductase alpha subunit